MRREDTPVATSAHTLADYAELARAHMESVGWDTIAAGGQDDRALATNVSGFDRLRLLPRVLASCDQPVTATRILDRTWPVPVGVAPTAYQTLAHPEGELATFRATASIGVPLVVSPFAGKTLESIASVAAGPLWLQVYSFQTRATMQWLMERAVTAGFEALVLTMGAPHLGHRLRDLPSELGALPGIRPVNLMAGDCTLPSEEMLAVLDPAPDWPAVDWLRAASPLPVLVKGVLAESDARRAIEAGVAGIIVSNHGGRWADGFPAAIEALPEIASVVAGRCPVLLDGGVRRGTDVLASLALGADAVLLGRPILHGLAVGEQSGVARVLTIIADELTDAMKQAGVRSVADVEPTLVRTGARSHPSALDGGSAAPTVRPTAPAEQCAGAGGRRLRRHDLHASVSDPVLDTMNFLNEITNRYPDAISFAPGRPYEGFFDTSQIFTDIQRYIDHLEETGNSPAQVREALFQYGPASGRIQGLIADWLRQDEGIEVPPESIVITVGGQEAMVLALRALIQGPDDVLLLSSPCYVGITGAARLLDIRVSAVPERSEGFACADLEAVVNAHRARGRRPRAFYVITDHSNPSGNTMPLETRHELLELATRLDLLILEDSPYRLVSPGPQLPTLKSLDPDRRVVHLGSFSKTMFPGARVGFAIADQLVADGAGGTSLLADELAKIKSMVTVNTSPLSQAAVAGMLLGCGGRASRRNIRTSAYYGNAMRCTLRCLDECLPADRRAALGVHWNEPSGGFFLAVDVPFRVDSAALVRSAEEFGVIWTPMSYFYPEGGGGETSIRLSVSYLSEADIGEGVSRFARFVEAAVQELPAASGPLPAS